MEELYAALTQTRKDRDEARWLNRDLTNERDEARRMYCEMASPVCGSKYTGPNSVAKDKGWDCYKSEETK